MNSTLVKQWMVKQRLNPKGLAAKLGVSINTAHKILAGERVYPSTIRLLALQMKVPESELITSSESEDAEEHAVTRG